MTAANVSRPNILIICCDQLSAAALPAYGNTVARTPNIDRITRRGVRFESCYTPCPLCLPARAAFWTGHWPHQTGVLSNSRQCAETGICDGLPTLGDLFSAAGYDTVHFGKTHDGGSLRGFRVAPWEDLPVEGTDAWPVHYDTRRDRYATTHMVEYLQRDSGDAPFLAVADLCNPHDICNWVGHNVGPHTDVPTGGPLPPLPANFHVEDFERRPIPVQYICCSHHRQSQAAAWNETNYRHYLAAYYHYLSRVDTEIGRVLDALASRGDADRTLIVFMADHGDGMACHGHVTKQVSLYDQTTRVPLVFAGPGVAGQGRAIGGDILTSLLDLVPTLCDVAGIEAPEDLWGRSLLPQLVGAAGAEPPHQFVASQWQTEWGFTVSPGRMIRSPRYKYTRYLEGDGEELFDMTADPGETRSLVGDPAHADALAQHRETLRHLIEATGDPFFDLPWQADARWRSHTPGYHHHTGPAAPKANRA